MLMPREQRALRGKEGTVSKCGLKEEEAMSVSWVAFQQNKLCSLNLYVAHTAQLGNCDQIRGKRIVLDLKHVSRTRQCDSYKWL